MKVFISQPMNGLTDEKIKAKREKLTAAYQTAQEHYATNARKKDD